VRRQTFFSLLGFLLWFPPATHAWEIASFETEVRVHEDATATVTETIVADFTGEERHGLFRDIPIHYLDRAGGHFLLRLRVREVTDALGRPWPWRLESSGRYRRIRIGDPDRTVTGEQTYRLVYTVERGAVRFFPDHDECYWNLTGNEWAVPLRRVRAAIELPAQSADVRAVAYVGGYGSTERLQTALELTRVLLEPPRPFQPYEGLTAAVSWGKGAVRPPDAARVLGWWLEDNWVYGLPLLVLGVMLWLWRRLGRDPQPGAQVVQYEPPDRLTPAEVGTLLDQEVHLPDITSTVIDLAVRGYLRIEPIESALFGIARARDYKLVKLKAWEADGTLKPHEREILTGLFGAVKASVELSDLEQVFYERLPKIRQHLYAGLVRAGYFAGSPEQVRRTYFAAGIVLGPLLTFGLMALQRWQQHVMGAGPVIAGICSGLIVLAFSRAMPRRTLRGAQATGQVFGFREFLWRTDQDRLKRMGSDAQLFERMLPYALAFGVADHWARAFEGLYTRPPSWYAGRWERFSTRDFSQTLDRTTTSMNRAFASAPRGSSSSFGGGGGGGGGFSGGGGGGGGGGAW
jgi:uncharacterized membrane protein YgcG